MAAGNTIEAKLRIAAEVAQAITALKSVRAELLATSKAAAGAGAGTSSGAGGAGGSAGAAATADATQVVGALKRRTVAEAEAAVQSKRLAKEASDRQQAAGREAKKLADEDEARRKKAQREVDRSTREQEHAARKTARATAGQRQQLAPQLNDIFVGLTTGQSPLQVALQQGPQITQIYGGVANAFRAALSVLTPLRVALGVAAGGFALLATQIAAGYRESSQLNKALALSGNIAGTSLAQISGTANTIATATGTSISFVREVLAEVIKMGGQTSTTLGATTRAVVALSKLTGQSADEAAKGFAGQADAVTEFATKANKAYNFLTAEQVAYIKTLERQGRTAEAIKFTNEQLAGTLEQRSVPAIGSLEKGWREVGAALAGVLDKLKEIGRDETAEAKLKLLQERAAGTGGQLPFKNLGEGLKFGLLGGNATEFGRTYLAELQARNVAERDGAQLQANMDAKRVEEQRQKLLDNQQKIKESSREFQQLAASQTAADAQVAFSNLQANLDRQQALVERARAEDLLSASDTALKLNAIEQARAEAQVALLRKQRNAQASVKGDKPEDVKQERAQLTQMEAQLITARARVATAVAQGRTLVDAEITRLDEELRRRRADNLGSDALRTQDPSERARQTADAAAADARKQFADLERDIRNRQQAAATVPGGARLQAGLQANLDEARKSLDELTRRATLDSLNQQAAELQQSLALKEREIDQLVEQSALSSEEAEQRKLAARAKALPQLQELLLLQLALAETPGERNAITQTILDLNQLQDKTTEVERTLRGSVKSGFADLFTSVLTGSKSALDGLRDFASGVAKVMLNIIAQRFAQKLAESIFGASGSTGGAGTGFNLAAFLQTIFATVKHSGGVIGAGSAGLGRSVSALAFAGAQVLHSGGLVGMDLARNERAVIAEVGEEMLTADDPRHVKNFRGNGVVMQTSITINGATGAEQNQNNELAQLQQMMLATVEQWATKQRRQGGILAGGGRG